MDTLISRMTTAMRETQELEKWEELKLEGGQLWERSKNTNFDREGVRERLQQAVENMENLIGVGLALRQGEVEIASRIAGSLVASLHEGSIVQPGWVEKLRDGGGPSV